MWDCETCGCQAIAGTITQCPVCHTPRNEDVAAGPSTTPEASPSGNAAPGGREAPQSPQDEGEWELPDDGTN